MTKKIHVLVDESLDGVKREYVEVERKAKVGELVFIHNCNEIPEINGLIAICTVNDDFDDGSIDVNIPSDLYGDFSFINGDGDSYGVLEPTDIVHIEGKRYKLVDRKAEVGEKILVIRSRQQLKPGTIGVCTSNNEFSDGSIDADLSFEGSENETFIDTDDTKYLVLVPLNPESINPQSYEDIIANLVRRVAELERHNEMQRNENRIVYDNIEGIKDDIVTWSQEHENLAFKVVDAEQEIGELKDKIEMCIDERTQSKQITLDVDTFTKIIGGARG